MTSSDSNHPKTPAPNTITLRVRASMYTFWEDSTVQSVTRSKGGSLLCYIFSVRPTNICWQSARFEEQNQVLGETRMNQEPPNSPLKVRTVPREWSTSKSICDTWASALLHITVYCKKLHEILLHNSCVWNNYSVSLETNQYIINSW